MSPHVRPLAGFRNMADPELVTTARVPKRLRNPFGQDYRLSGRTLTIGTATK